MFGFSKYERQMKKAQMQIQKLQAKSEVLKYKSAIQSKKSAISTKKGSHLADINAEMNALRQELAPQNAWVEILNTPAVASVIDGILYKLGGGPSKEKLENLGSKIQNITPSQKKEGMAKLGKFMQTLTPKQKMEGLQLVTEFVGELEHE